MTKHHDKDHKKLKNALRSAYTQINLLKDNIGDKNKDIEKLHERIKDLEHIEKKYYLNQTIDKDSLIKECTSNKKDLIKTIHDLRQEITKLRRINYEIRNEEHTLSQTNGISYLEYRVRKSLINKILHNTIYEGFSVNQESLRNLSTEELIELNSENPSIVADFLEDENFNRKMIHRLGIKRVLKDKKRKLEEKKILYKHRKFAVAHSYKLRLLTYTALKVFNMLSEDSQDDLLIMLVKNEKKVWNAAFIKGYYYLKSILGKDNCKFNDLKFNGNNEKSNIIFKETIYELFGSFVMINNNEAIVVPGLRSLANGLRSTKDANSTKGIIGEMLAAYYYKKVMKMEIISFEHRVNTNQGTMGEVDIIALDQNNTLWDIEVKNCLINSLSSCRHLSSKIIKQLTSIYREKALLDMKKTLEKTKKTKINIGKRAVLVADRPYTAYIEKLLNSHNIKSDMLDLIPSWMQLVND